MTDLVNTDFILANSAAFHLRLFDDPLDSDERLRLNVSYSRLPEGLIKLAYRNGLGKLEHLFRDLMLILLARNDQNSLQSLSLLSESEKDNFGAC